MSAYSKALMVTALGALERLQSPLSALGAQVPAALRRVPALAADLHCLDDGASAGTPPAPAAAEYARRLQGFDRDDAHRLLAARMAARRADIS